MAEGWLTFELQVAPREKRRLAPIPRDWEHVSETELRLMLQRAEVVPPARRNVASFLEQDSAPPRA